VTISQFNHQSKLRRNHISSLLRLSQIILKLVNKRYVFTNETKSYHHFRPLCLRFRVSHCTVVSVKLKISQRIFTIFFNFKKLLKFKVTNFNRPRILELWQDFNGQNTTIRYRLWDAVSKKIYVTYRLVVAAAVCSMTYHVMPLTPVLCWLHSWILRPCYTSSSSSRLSAVQRQASSSCRVVQCTRQAAAAVDRSLNNLPSDNSALHFAAQLRNRTDLKVYCGYCHLYFILFYFCTLVYLARTACNQQRTPLSSPLLSLKLCQEAHLSLG